MLYFTKRSIRALEDLTPGAHNSSPADALISELGRKKQPSHSYLHRNQRDNLKLLKWAGSTLNTGFGSRGGTFTN